MARFLTSDHHFNHANIIEYANRPFGSVEEMNRELVRRWNETVSDGDVVYHLGDLSQTSHEHWLRELNGSLILIRGNHDRLRLDRVGFPVLTECNVHAPNGLGLTLRHYPEPWDGGGWLIHGHSHIARPAIDLEAKRACVCVELTGYRPLRFSTVADELSRITEWHKLDRWTR